MEENKKFKSILESNHIEYKDDKIIGENGGTNIVLKEHLQFEAVFYLTPLEEI